jgi:hypothetical protein
MASGSNSYEPLEAFLKKVYTLDKDENFRIDFRDLDTYFKAW